MTTTNGTDILFEHPLTEKMRIFLRVEFLLIQIHQNRHFTYDNALLFFHSLSELIEIMERSDLKTELLRAMDEQKFKLRRWESVEGVDQDRLKKTLEMLTLIGQELHKAPKQSLEFKHCILLTSIRKRLTIPGGCCNFDIPNFHLWMALPLAEREPKIQEWLKPIEVLNNAITLLLKCVRESSEFETASLTNNYYQQSDEPFTLLRIKLPLSYQLYPQVSGNATRYTLRFVPLDPKQGQFKDKEITFQLAMC